MRYAARGKAYSYYFRTGGGGYAAGAAFEAHSMYLGQLAGAGARGALAAAVALFRGTHDFGAFSKGRGGMAGSEVRRVEEARVTVLRPEEYALGLEAGAPPEGAGEPVEAEAGDGAPPPPPPPAQPLRIVRVRFVANGFLRHQVRLMVGAAVAVATGRLTLAQLGAHLAGGGGGMRSGGGPRGGARGFMAASVRGLWLERTLLPQGFWEDPHWCNNRDPQYPADRGIPRGSWHPGRVCPSTGAPLASAWRGGGAGAGGGGPEEKEEEEGEGEEEEGGGDSE